MGELARTSHGTGWPLRYKLVLLLALVAASVVGNLLYDRLALRTIIVNADTGTLRVTLTRELGGEAFREAIVCRPREEPDFSLSGSSYGCAARTHEVVQPAEAQRISLPADTQILLSSTPDWIQLVVEEIPEKYVGTDVARLETGRLTLSGSALADFDRMLITGRAVLGAASSEPGRRPTVNGSYEIRGWTPTSRIRGELGILKTGQLRPGALFFIRDLSENAATVASVAPLEAPAAEARIHIIGRDPETSLFDVTAVSMYRPVRLTEADAMTDAASYGATLVDALLHDPIVVFLATLIASGVGVLTFFAPRSGGN